MTINENNILMRPFFYLLLLLCHQHLFGQNPARFSRLYDENDLWQGFSAGIEIENNHQLLSGFNIGSSASSFFIWNIVLNQDGDTISTRKITSGDSSTYYLGKQSLVRTTPTSYYLTGTREYYDEAIADGFLMKFDENGERMWEKNYGGLNYDFFDAMVVNSQGDLVLAGVSHSFGDSTWGNIYVVKTDTAGELIWQKSLGINDFPERCWSMDTTSDGGYVLTGTQGFYEQDNVFVIKIDSLGNQKWKKTFGAAIGHNRFPCIRSLRNGDFLLTTGQKTSINGLSKAYITRLSPTGVKLWQKYYPGEQWHSWFGFSTETSDGSLVNAGGEMEFDSTNNNYRVLGTLTKTDAQGNLIWQRKYYTRHDRNNYFFGMIPASDSGFLTYGFAYRADNNRQDAWAVKVDSLGCLEPGCAGSVAAPEPGAAIGLSIRPNPVADWLTVASPEAVLLGLRLTDLSGRVLEDVQFFRQHRLREYRLSLAALPPGLYVLSVRTEKGWVGEQVVKN